MKNKNNTAGEQSRTLPKGDALNLPKGWEMKKLGEVCEIFNGSTPLRSKKEFWENGTINWFTIDDIRKQGRKIYSTEQKITELALANTSLKVLPKKTVLLCCTASVGEFAITETELSTNQQFNGLVVKNGKVLFPEFLYYFSSTLKDKLLDVSSKTTIDFVSMTKLREVTIPIPPLPEQQHIVALLDQAFEAINQAKQNLEKNLQNAKELFESELQSIFSNKGDGMSLSNDWEEKTLKEIGLTQTGNTPKTSEADNYGDYIPFVKPPHFNVDGTIDSKESKLSEKGLKSARLFRENSILMVCIGATIGKTGFAEIPLTSNQQINCLTPKNEYHAKFFYYGLISSEFQNKVLSAGTSSQATLPIINKSKWESLTISFPKSKTEQQKIVTQLDALRAQTQQLETLYSQKLLQLEELKKSILEMAFNGKLKTQLVEAQ